VTTLMTAAKDTILKLDTLEYRAWGVGLVT